MQWRTRRKLTYTILALLPLLVVAGVIYAATFFPQPTCFDGEQNQDETGIDCGGSCIAVCQDQTAELSVVWDRAFQVSGDIYSLAAYVENPNTDLMAENLPYVFRLYDDENILITERRGSTTILPQVANVVFVGGINTNGRQPGRVVFDFTSPPYWENPRFATVDFPISNRNLKVDQEPRLSFEVTNKNNQPFSTLEFTGIIFTVDGEAVHLSQTIIDRLDVEEAASVVFTWRQPFTAGEGPYRTEIIPTSYQVGQ